MSDQLLAVEPLGTQFVPLRERHGKPSALFFVWFSANAEIATWMVGLFAVALYGTSLRGAIAGIIAGNVLGFGLLGVLSMFGPRYGVPQMVASRLPFGWGGNALPAALSFLAGVGWFSINSIFGAYALQTVTHLSYALSLILILGLQIVLAVYGYRVIHLFERLCAILLAGGFVLLGFATFSRAQFGAPFDPHAPLSAGGEMGGMLFAGALAFSYATGWVPCASDYSRYLSESTSRGRIWWFSFLGCVVPCIALEIMGAATVSAVHTSGLADASPTRAIETLLGNGVVATLVLMTVALGTLTANCMNLYSGALAALVVKFPDRSWRGPILLALAFFVITATIALLAHAAISIALFYSALVALLIVTVARVQLARWVAALGVGVVGALLASSGGHPEQTAKLYTNFLLLLSYWAAPWSAVVFFDWLRHRNEARDPFATRPLFRRGTVAWLAGLAASVPFWNQAWFTGPFAAAHPEYGDLSYYVGFVVSAVIISVMPANSAAK